MTSPQLMAEDHTALPENIPRRGILIQLFTAAVSFILVAVPSTLGGLFFLDPILRKRNAATGGVTQGEITRKDDAGFIRLDVTKDAVPPDGTPLAVTVRDDSIDGWNKLKDVPVGSIWLRKIGDGPVIAFNSVCPHLGCSVNFRRAENDFFCPCHTSCFTLNGTKTNEVPPRDMDALDVAMRTNGQDDVNGSEIWIRYQNFRRATAEKIVI